MVVGGCAFSALLLALVYVLLAVMVALVVVLGLKGLPAVLELLIKELLVAQVL